MKTCRRCGVTYSIGSFRKRANGLVRHQCVLCDQVYAREWYQLNRGRANANGSRWREENPDAYHAVNLRREYDMTIPEYNALGIKQNWLCNICLGPETAKHQSGKTKRLAVDHNKETGVVRGLLCQRCNTGIGLLMHSVELLERAKLHVTQKSGPS